MEPDRRPCPVCGSTVLVHAEQLAHGWAFCPALARCYQLDAEGHLLRIADSQHQAPLTARPTEPQ